MKSIIPLIISCITLLLFQNCGTTFTSQQTVKQIVTTTDQQFYPYIQEFEYYYGETTAHIPIGFADLDPKIAGICYRSVIAGKTLNAYIVIDYDYWYKITEYQRINLIFHELGHCALGKPHVPSDSVSLCPSSFMFEQIMSTSCIRDNYDAYIEELFR